MGLHEAAEMLIYRSLIPEKKRNAELQVLYDDDSHNDDNNIEIRAFFVHLLKVTYLGKVSKNIIFKGFFSFLGWA